MAAAVSVPSLPRLNSGQRFESGGGNDTEECWICLSSAGLLTRPCECPRVCHRECIATWQLTNYGRREESFCRFCNKWLPALWKPDPTQELVTEELRVAPVMAVRYNGPEGTREFKLRVRPGPEGLAMFKAHLKQILGFDVGPEFDVTFECQMPATGSMVTLSGLNAYGAATHCAALLAANKASGPQPAPAATAAGPATLTARQHCATHSRTPIASAAPVSSRPAAGDRRACQTGYLPSRTNPCVPPSLWTSAQHQALATHAALWTHRRDRGHMARSVSTRRRFVRAASDNVLDEGGAEYNPAQDLYDELLPFGPRDVMIATPIETLGMSYGPPTTTNVGREGQHQMAASSHPASSGARTRVLAGPLDQFAGPSSATSPFALRSRSSVTNTPGGPTSALSVGSDGSSMLGPASSSSDNSSKPSSGLLSTSSLPPAPDVRRRECPETLHTRPSPSKLHLPDVLRNTAKRTMHTLMRALRQSKK